MSKRELEPSGGSDLGNRLAALAFEGHKKRRREEEREKSRFAPDLERACEQALSKFERDAEEVGETDFAFTFSCERNVHWFPVGENEVFEALPEKVKTMARDPNFLVKVVPAPAYNYKISLNVEKRTEELIDAADEKAEASGVPYWK